jgi:hypothetical protein
MCLPHGEPVVPHRLPQPCPRLPHNRQRPPQPSISRPPALVTQRLPQRRRPRPLPGRSSSAPGRPTPPGRRSRRGRAMASSRRSWRARLASTPADPCADRRRPTGRPAGPGRRAPIAGSCESAVMPVATPPGPLRDARHARRGGRPPLRPQSQHIPPLNRRAPPSTASRHKSSVRDEALLLSADNDD